MYARAHNPALLAILRVQCTGNSSTLEGSASMLAMSCVHGDEDIQLDQQ
jgi:hypothetical protein